MRPSPPQMPHVSLAIVESYQGLATLTDIPCRASPGRLASLLQCAARRTTDLKATNARPRRPSMKLGRNDPCHCGSGQKYKKCHLPLEEGGAAVDS